MATDPKKVVRKAPRAKAMAPLPEAVKTIPLTLGESVPLSLAKYGGLVYAVSVRDNTDFSIKFDPDSFKGKVTRPTKTVVVGQDPDPGDFVPAGTPINVQLVVKDDLPTGSFKGVDPVIAGKYEYVGSFQADIENADDRVAKDAKDVLDKNADYHALSTGDQRAVDAFMEERFGAEAVNTPEKKSKVYNDVKFIYTI